MTSTVEDSHHHHLDSLSTTEERAVNSNNMVLETTSDGLASSTSDPAAVVGTAGAISGGYGDTYPTYPNVYNSTRIIQNWEMARMAHLVMERQPPVGDKLGRRLLDDRADKLFRDHKWGCQGATEGLYQCMLAWQESKGCYGTVGEMARRLREMNLPDIAELFPP